MDTFNDQHSLEEYIQQYRRVLVLLCASWCPFCVRFFPIFERLVPKKAFDKTMRVYIDDDDNPLWYDFSIEAIPTLIFFEQGKATSRLDANLGLGLNEKTFSDWLNKL
ncbi:MAG: thioredoxin family protein [Chloroflexota bacterium]